MNSIIIIAIKITKVISIFVPLSSQSASPFVSSEIVLFKSKNSSRNMAKMVIIYLSSAWFIRQVFFWMSELPSLTIISISVFLHFSAHVDNCMQNEHVFQKCWTDFNDCRVEKYTLQNWSERDSRKLATIIGRLLACTNAQTIDRANPLVCYHDISTAVLAIKSPFNCRGRPHYNWIPTTIV